MSAATTCAVCGRSHPMMAEMLGICPDCARTDRAIPPARAAHAHSRGLFALPEAPPQAEHGIRCTLCANNCVIGEGEFGYCGLRTVHNGRLRHLRGTPRQGMLHWYHDPLPTNCVAAWTCAASRKTASQTALDNLAVFYQSCTLDCLYCQNWHFRAITPSEGTTYSAQAVSEAANRHTFCVCFFGGDPASQMPHALSTGRLLAEQGVVVCWETAGTSHPRLLDRAVQLSLESGGTIKFDLKAYTDPLHIALTGGSNRRTLTNFARAAARFNERPTPPLVVASTLLVPGYVTPEEVNRIATFIARLNPAIPYSLLAFAPNYLMPDLPVTSMRHAEAARQAALDAGLEQVHIGNRHLLGNGY